MPESKVLEEENVNGMVLRRDERRIGKVGDSYVIRPPKRWVKDFPSFLNLTLLEIKLVEDENGDLVIVIKKPR